MSAPYADAEAQLAAERLVAGVPPCFHPVVQRYGRQMYTLVMQSGMAQNGLDVLATAADKRRDEASRHAVVMVAHSFNTIANELITAKGWTQEELAQCDRDLQLAFAGSIQVPTASRLILPTQ